MLILLIKHVGLWLDHSFVYWNAPSSCVTFEVDSRTRECIKMQTMFERLERVWLEIFALGFVVNHNLVASRARRLLMSILISRERGVRRKKSSDSLGLLNLSRTSLVT